MAKRIQDPSARLGNKTAAHWRNLEDLDRIYMAKRDREMENPVVAPQQPRDQNTPTTVDKDTSHGNPNYPR